MTDISRADWHVHYFRDGCADSEMKVQPILDAAIERGIKEIGLLGHFRNRFVIQDLAYLTAPNPKFFAFLQQDVSEALAGKSNITVRIGAEIDINTLDGKVSITPEQASDLDFVMAGIHWPPTMPPLLDYIDLKEPQQALEAYCSHNIIPPEEFSVERVIEDIFNSMINAVKRNPFIDIIAHPAGIATKLGAICLAMEAESLFEELAIALAKNEVAYELNAEVFREYEPEALEKFVTPLISTCAEADVYFTIGSDAHLIKNVGNLESALAIRERLNIPEKQLIITLEGFPGKTSR